MSINDEKLQEWHKRFLFSLPEELNENNFRPIFGYMIRELSRGRVPSYEIINKALEKDFKMPPCGYINCFWDEEHVH